MSTEYSKKVSYYLSSDTNDSNQLLPQECLSLSSSSLDSNKEEAEKYHVSFDQDQHFNLDLKEYERIKQTLIELNLPNEFKILNTNSHEAADNVFGDWNTRTKAHSKVFLNKPIAPRSTYSNNCSSTLIYKFRNFNDWRSHLIYYKQRKNSLRDLPNILKDLKQNNILPTVVRQIENQDFPARKSIITRSQTLINFNKEPTKIIENENFEEPFSIKSLRSKYLSHSSPKSKTTDSLFPNNEINFFAPASSSNSVPKQNIDFKMDFNKQKPSENPNQKFIPYLKGKRAGGGVLRVSSDIDKSKIQLQQIPTNILKKFINQKSNSFNSGITSILSNQNNETVDDTYYTITSINNAEKGLNSSKRVVSFYDNENEENLKSAQSRKDENSMGFRSKSSKPGTKYDSKVPIGQPSLAQFIKTANLVTNKSGSNMKNFKQIANKIKKQQKELMKQRQSNELDNKCQRGMVPELKGVSVSEKNLPVNQPVRFELAN